MRSAGSEGVAGHWPVARLNVQVDGQQDALGTFIFRTTGYNSVRTLAARLKYFEAVSGGLTHCLPLLLRLRAKTPPNRIVRRCISSI